jgi:phage terminase large subunit GpA-like protein
MVSTPTVKDFSRIETAYLESDKRVFLLPCDHCGSFSQMFWRNIRWPEGRMHEAMVFAASAMPDSETSAGRKVGCMKLHGIVRFAAGRTRNTENPLCWLRDIGKPPLPEAARRRAFICPVCIRLG